MVGRKQFDPDDALDAAIRAFWARGYPATSISDLVEATGLSRGSMYATFGDKQDLFLACLTRYVETVGAPGRAALDVQSMTLQERVQAGFDAILDRMRDPANPPGCLLAQTAAESGALDPRARDAVQRILEDQVRQMSDVLAEDAPGRAEDPDVQSMARYLVTMAQAIAVMHRAGMSIDQLTLTARHAVRALDTLSV